MVNYDTQDGYSVASFQSTPPQPQLLKHTVDETIGHNNDNRLEMLEHHIESPETVALGTTLGANGLTLQSHLLAPSTSILTIKEVHFKHAGNYTCAPSNARAGTITIHVLRGKLYSMTLRTYVSLDAFQSF